MKPRWKSCNIIISITNGDIPKPYDLLSMDAEQPEQQARP
jgi:hypothetical protein